MFFNYFMRFVNTSPYIYNMYLGFRIFGGDLLAYMSPKYNGFSY